MQHLSVGNSTAHGEAIDISDAARVQSELGDDAVAWASQVGLQLAQDVTAAVPDLGGNPAHFQSLRRATTSTVLRSLLLAAGSVEHLSTDEARANARDFAKRGVPLGDMLRAIRVGHARLDAALFEAVAQGSTDPSDVLSEMQRISEILFTQIDVFASAMEAEFRDEYEHGIAASVARRMHAVSRVLTGDLDGADASALLHYNMNATHIGLVAWSTDAVATGKDGDLREHVAALLHSVGATELLLVPVGAGALWAWGASRSINPDRLTQLAPIQDIAIAAGEPRHGLAGFRQTHHEAREVENLVSRSGKDQAASMVTLHRDVALAILLTRDPDAARMFVASVLGDLAADDRRTQQARLTLRTYLDEARSLIATAEKLQISRNTVTYRVARASQLCGRSVQKEHLLLHAALVAHDHLS